ncbi:MAG: serine/threonine-protein kinase [Pseudomonadota bacterium]
MTSDTLDGTQGATKGATQKGTEAGKKASFPDAPPVKIGKYEVRGEIGRGSCGVVYKGFDPFVQRDVAIKVALHDPKHISSTMTNSGRTSFFVEARAAGMLQHPHIVSLYDAAVEGAVSYIVMEYINGETLLPLCRKKGPRAPLDQVVDIVFKCAKALDYSHSKGVMHRDIKPSNIMITQDGVPKIMDFSIAEINAQPGGSGGIFGSPLYMSPEQVRAEVIGPQADLYSLGAVLFHLLTGEPPFTGADIQAVFEQIKKNPAPRVEDKRADVPKPLCDIVEKLLTKDPAQRFQTGGDLAVSLSRFFDQLRLSGQQLSRRETGDSLRRLHFFNGFSDADIDEILSASAINGYQPGQEIIQEGEIEHAFFIIAKGSAEVRKGNKALNTLQKGDCFGEIGFLTAAKRTASVVAATQVTALKVNASLMEKVSPECQLRFYKVFTEALIYRLTVTSAKLSALS